MNAPSAALLLASLVSAPVAQGDFQLAPGKDIGTLPALSADSWSPEGIWRADSGFYATAAHATLLADGRVLFIGYQRSTLEPDPTAQVTRFVGLFQPTPDGAPVPEEVVLNDMAVPLDVIDFFSFPLYVSDDLFCTGFTQLADGRVFTAGGRRAFLDLVTGDLTTTGLSYAMTFDGATWTREAEDMVGAGALGDPMRWYPTTTRLPDGRILVVNGDDLVQPVPLPNLSAEIFDPATGAWQLVSPYGDVPLQLWNPDYTHSFVLPVPQGGADLVLLGFDGLPGTFDLDTGTWTLAGQARGNAQPFEGPNIGASSTMLPIRVDDGEWGYGNGSVLVAGGPMGTSHHFNADVFDVESGAWLPRIPMGTGRHHPTTVLLPDGQVLVVAGHSPDPAVTHAQLIDPANGFAVSEGIADMGDVRGYHAVSLLLPDGRVLVGGGADVMTNPGEEKATFRYYRPWYMDEPRPGIVSAPPVIPMGAPFSVVTAGQRPKEVVLIALGAMTHSVDMNQRYVQLPVQGATPLAPGLTNLAVTGPADGRVAPPGMYMLFVVDAHRVPSEAVIVQVQ